MLRRRSLAALRAEVEPVEKQALARFLPAWNGIGVLRGSDALRGTDGLLRAVEQLAGALIPASALESLVLPARIPGYTPAMLDELTTAGEVLWTGHGSLAGDDGWIALHLAETAPLTIPLPDCRRGACRPASCTGRSWTCSAAAARSSSGRWPTRSPRPSRPAPERAEPRSAGAGRCDDASIADALWDLVFAGLVSSDTLAPLRARLTGGRPPTAPGRRRRGPGCAARPVWRCCPPVGTGADRRATPAPGSGARCRRRWWAGGRWCPEVETDATVRTHAAAEVLLDRHGIVTRGAVVAEGTVGGFAAVYRVLSALEETGRIRRGYFVEGLGAAQFASAGAVDRVRGVRGPAGRGPAGPGRAGAGRRRPGESVRRGAALAGGGRQERRCCSADERARRHRPGPVDRHRPARRAGALTVLVDGEAVLYAERGGRSLLSFTADPAVLAAAAEALAERVRSGRIGSLTITKIDGAEALTAAGPVVEALTAAGFTMTPRGLRLRSPDPMSRPGPRRAGRFPMCRPRRR